MNLPLLSVLNRLVEETRTFLHAADADVDRWEAYLARRTTLLVALEGMPCSADDLANPPLISLKEEIVRQEALVQERAVTKLASVGAELRMVASGRRALHGYGSSSSPILFERNI